MTSDLPVLLGSLILTKTDTMEEELFQILEDSWS